VPDSLRAELANVVWQWCTHRDLSLEIGRSVLDDADALISHTVPANHLWHRALEISSEVRHPIRIGCSRSSTRPCEFHKKYRFNSRDTERALFIARSLASSSGDVDRIERALAWKMRGWLLGLPEGAATGRAIVKVSQAFWKRSYSG